ncbi:fibronectin type III domain-containing protein [Luedemannella flava]
MVGADQSRIQDRGYELEVSPPVGGARRVTGTTYTWTGLTNGVAYTFRVRAYNASPTPSEWSADSAPETPAKAPDAPAAPTAAGVTDGIGKQINVQWAPPNTNGAPISGYELTVLRARVVNRTVAVDGDTTGATVDVDNGVDYTFRVVAINKAGKSTPSADSAVTVAHGKPFQVTSLIVTDNSGGTGFDRRIHYALNPPNDNGMAIVRYEFNYSGGTAVEYSRRPPAARAGPAEPQQRHPYRLRVRACNDMCGEWSALSAAVIPYGLVNTPGARAAKNGARQVTLSWTQPSANGRPIAHLEISINGGGWENVGTGNGSRNVGDGPNQTWQIRVQAVDSAGQRSAIASSERVTPTRRRST